MKLTNFFKSIALGSILVFSFGCGKDNKSGPGYGYNMQYSNNLSQGGQQAHTQFKQWYERADSYLQAGSYVVTRAKTGYQTGGATLPPGCKREEVKIFGTVIGYTVVCTGGSGTGTNQNIRECGVNIIANNNNNNSNSSKVNNPILRKIYSGGYGILVDGTVNGGIVTLIFQQSNGQLTGFQVNTQGHGAFEPTILQDSTGIDKRLNVQSLGFNGIGNLPACF